MIQGKKTVLEQVADQCTSAFQAHIPVIYLLTDEMELVDEIVDMQNMVQLVKLVADHGFVAYDEYLKAENLSKWNSPPDNFKSNENCFPFPFTIPGGHSPEIGVVKNYNLFSDSFGKATARYIHQYISARGDSEIRHSVLILAAPILSIPQGLESYIEVIDVPAPEDYEIADIIDRFALRRRESLVREYRGNLIDALKGFSRSKIIMILQKIISRTEFLANNERTKNRKAEDQPETVSLAVIKKEKEQMLKKSGVLTLIKPEKVPVGGLQGLLEWLNRSKIILDRLNEARDDWNIEFPKGILISGIPGSGKSLMAKKTAELFGMPLVKMDMGALMGSHIGESENNMRTALKLAEALSPCVLWIDELEKGFAGVGGSGDGDSGTLKRIFASFLTWMQDNKSMCFIFATANDISQLPPEFLRRGRFDKKFHVFMPMRAECIEIFQKVLEKVNSPRNTGNSKPLFDQRTMSTEFLGRIVDSCVRDGQKKFLTGADIEGIVKDAVIQVFMQQSGTAIEAPCKISAREMENALCCVIKQTQTYGETNLHEIAKCFIGLCKNKFSPATGEDGSRVLFESGDFQADRTPAITRERKLPSLYDQVLYDTLRDEINSVALMIKELEKNE